MTEMVKDILNVTAGHSQRGKHVKRSVSLTEIRMLPRAPAHEQGVLSTTASLAGFHLKNSMFLRNLQL